MSVGTQQLYWALLVLALPAVVAWPTAPARAESPAATCLRLGTEDTLREIPRSLVHAVNTAFGTRMPARVVLATTVFRCANAHVLVCTTGANLPCGRANTDRMPAPGAVDWCREHPDDTFIPAAVVGHETIYDWRCRIGAPEIARQAHEIDGRGFFAQYWKRLR